MHISLPCEVDIKKKKLHLMLYIVYLKMNNTNLLDESDSKGATWNYNGLYNNNENQDQVRLIIIHFDKCADVSRHCH